MILISIFLIQIIITILFTSLAVIFDVRQGIVPNMLMYIMCAAGLVTNAVLSLISHNIKFILASLISMFVTFIITYLLWQLDMWGGGDVRLFTGIASVIPTGLNVDFLNIFPVMSVYPFSFSVLINSILVSFPFLCMFVVYLILKSDLFKNRMDFVFNILNFTSLVYIKESIMKVKVPVNELAEGMIINRYYFDDDWISKLIDENEGNLKVYKSDDSEFKYYFKSQSAGGIMDRDVNLLKVMYAQGYIIDNLYKKISFPFTPAIFGGLIIAIFFGDLMMLFTKNLYLVV